MQLKQDRIGVFVRVRPYQQKQQNSAFILSQTPTDIAVRDRDKEQDLRFAFDGIFPPNVEQRAVYETVALPIVQAAFEGINGTVFAYGQTSSGKTFTCVGPDCEDAQKKGILPRCIQSIFAKIASSPNYLQFRIKVSMVEIYMERIKDLLDPGKVDLKIRENKSKGVHIQEVTEEYVSSPQETIRVFKKGVGNRAVAFTNMNDFSSRSHMAFILTLHQSNLKDGSARSGKITVVDLAGSEKVSKTLAEGKLLDEAKQINKSLSCLGNVINALTEAKSSHVPYRDSKLTRLLQESLGGNSKTSLIINISPSAYNAAESISSLRFGFRAKDIKNRPKINKEYTIPELLLLLEKAEKRNQELELMLKELTTSIAAKKPNKTTAAFVENLLDSDNPIMSGIEDSEPEPAKRVSLRSVRKYYESQIASEGEEESQTVRNKSKEVQPQQQKEPSEVQVQLRQIIEEKEQELSILGEELNRINSERVDLVRELDICRERLELAAKEARLGAMKFNSEKKQSENLLQKFIKENIENQEKAETIANLHSKMVDFEQRFIKLSQINSESAKQSKVFGVNKSLHQQTARILREVLGAQQQQAQSSLKKEAMAGLEKQRRMEQQSSKLKQLQTELCTLKHLEESKQQFIKEKLKFITERDRIYKDLENRIEKVLELEERLDEEKERRMYLEELIATDQSGQARKVLALERHIASVSEEFYVLKGQQSGWKRTHDQLEKKAKQQAAKMRQMESQNIELKVEIEGLRMHCIELEAIGDNQSQLDLQFSEVEPTSLTGNIVKVLRSGIYELD